MLIGCVGAGRRFLISVAILSGLLVIASVKADAQDTPFGECFTRAAAVFHVPRNVLVGIARVESGFNQTATHENGNGTTDIGLMQINSTWLPSLAKSGITRSDLFDGCTSIRVGAWVLHNNINSYGMTWRAVGAYNARSDRHRREYVGRVWRAIAGGAPSRTKPTKDTSNNSIRIVENGN